MKKADLRSGMVVEDDDGSVGVVLLNTATQDGIKWFLDADHDNIDFWEDLSNYDDDLKALDYSESDDIVKVFQPHNFNDYTTKQAYSDDYLIWDKFEGDTTISEEYKEITLSDIEKKFGCKVKIVS